MHVLSISVASKVLAKLRGRIVAMSKKHDHVKGIETKS